MVHGRKEMKKFTKIIHDTIRRKKKGRGLLLRPR
jgi:hypothetical protein